MPPVPRQEVLDAYWRLAAERQRILFRRLAGDAGPWTEDPILAEYKFCNAYRASDRVSQYLIREVIYGRADYTAEDDVLRIVLFRLFSKPATWELLVDTLGDVTVETFRSDGFGRVLDDAFSRGRKLYTGAFILCANRAFGHDRKHRNHLALLELMLRPGGLPQSLANAKSLRELYDLLASYPLIGPFMAYQLAIDLNYSELCSFSENEHAVAGPGAKRGITKCFVDTVGWDDDRLIRWMADRQAEEFERLNLDFESLYGRPLQAIDIQNLFCELDKYSRVAFPDLKSNRTRIKARFAPTAALPTPFYPPKWGLDPAPAVPPADAHQIALPI
ncbi:nucleotide kinase domain-containing protein [Conexibacter woesei]|uniref:nucleotide kinase domain-containing protein n=1 Tax=Conexibacter woesei TaxID=191495 RepID=UPI00047BAA13|nr:nucleotide kinase domain-containing protein [Conexibacter woesei]